MKPQFGKSFLLTLITASFIMSSCGKKNVVNSSSTGNYSAFSGNSTLINQYNNIKSKVSCPSGRTRLNNDALFNTTSAYSQSRILGSFNQGVLSGTASDMYVGVSYYGDIMFVTKMTNGSSVTGYNVQISMCSIPNSYANYPALVSNDRSLTNFQLPVLYINGVGYQGIYLNSNNGCSTGQIALAGTYMVSNRIPSNAYTQDFGVYTTFSSSGCY